MVTPGAIHLPGWLDQSVQRQITDAYGTWAAGPVPARAAVLPGGRRMSVEMVCLGWHWKPYQYSRTADDVNGAHVAEMPDWLVALGRAAVEAAYGGSAGRTYRPDTALVNHYADGARMGMHQDKDEVVNQPVVSFSVGDDCLFRFGNPTQRGKPYTDVLLRSGDAFVFGHEARFAYHGVPKTYPATASPLCGLAGGRINITLRVTGLEDRSS